MKTKKQLRKLDFTILESGLLIVYLRDAPGENHNKQSKYRIRVAFGEDIKGACETLARKVAQNGHQMYAEFNEVFVIAKPGDSAELLISQYFRKLSESIKEYKNSAKYRKQEYMFNLNTRKKKDEYERLLNSIATEAIEIHPGREKEYQEFKEKNSDSYGGAVVRYAEIFARTLQIEMKKGIPLEEVASDLSEKCGNEGITGFMYNFAIQSLSYFWKYGEQLRKWHNLENQIGDEGERANETPGAVINTSMLIVSM